VGESGTAADGGVSARALVIAAVALVNLLGWVGSARASTVMGFTATANTYSAGASAVEYAIQFTPTTQIPATTGYIELTAPAGATLSDSTTNYHVQPVGPYQASSEAASVTVDPGGAGDNVADVYVPTTLAAGAAVVVDAYESSNPASAAPSATFSVSTSADTTPPTAVSFAITGPSAVSALSVTSTSQDAGSQEVEDAATFTATSSVIYADNQTFPESCLDGECNRGGIFLAAPTGTVFANFALDYEVKDLTTGQVSQSTISAAVDPTGAGDNTVELFPAITINAGDQVQALAYEVENPPSPEPGSFSVSTTSDVTAASTSFPYGSPVAPASVAVAVTSTTGGATNTGYVVGLTTTQGLPFYNGGSDGTGYVVLTFPSGTTAGSLGGATAYMSDATHTTPEQAGPPGQYGYTFSNNVVDIPVPFTVPADDQLTVTLKGAKNPTTFSYPEVSTTADTVATAGTVPTQVTATAGNVSAQLSWNAVAIPSGATVDYIITPFVGSTAQTPVDTLSSGTSFDIPGLTNGTAYTFEVQAKLTDGSTTYVAGPMSAASNTVTPSGSGAGPPQATASATTLAFGTEFLRQTTASQTVKMFNTGFNPLAISSVSVTRADAGDFAIDADTCAGQSLPSGQSCSVSVAFTPQASGARSADLAFADNASGSPHEVALTGTGTDTATISGTITATATGAPIADVAVFICASALSPAVSAVCGTATTNASGQYSMSGLTLGAGDVTFSPQGAAANNYHPKIFAANLVLGTQTIDGSLSSLQMPASGVTVTGATTENGFPAPFVGSPMGVAFTPDFPPEPAGTELAFITTATVSEVDNVPAVVGPSGSVVLLVSYGPSGTPTVIGQYADTASGPSPALNFQPASPGASRDLIGASFTTQGPILLQYLSSGQLQATFTPGEFYPGTKAFQTCTRYAVVSSAGPSVQVQASRGSYAFGAVSPAPEVSSCSATGGANFNLYFDPSGKVQSTTHIPLASAKVTLLRATGKDGPFKAVENGSTVMSVANRRNPDHTNALGLFGWDTIAGDYRVTASHPGCTASGRQQSAETRVYVVPPPVNNIAITLKCPHLKRAPSHLRLTLKAIRGTMTAVTATVAGHAPVGSVVFSGPGVSGVSLPLGARSHQATFILTRARQRITVRYLGDAHNAPSAASGHAS
jgi:HYDIN/CFA65/VesB family protein